MNEFYEAGAIDVNLVSDKGVCNASTQYKVGHAVFNIDSTNLSLHSRVQRMPVHDDCIQSDAYETVHNSDYHLHC